MVSNLSAAPAISFSVGSSGVSGIGGHHGSSADVASASVSSSVVSRSSSEEGSSTASPAEYQVPSPRLQLSVWAGYDIRSGTPPGSEPSLSSPPCRSLVSAQCCVASLTQRYVIFVSLFFLFVWFRHTNT